MLFVDEIAPPRIVPLRVGVVGFIHASQVIAVVGLLLNDGILT